MPSRTLALAKRVSLSEFSEGWEQCYALVRPATFAEATEFAKLDFKDRHLTNEEQLMIEFDFVESHFAGGKVRILDSDGEPSDLVDMTADDVRQSVPMTNKLFRAILGLNLNPKDEPETAPSSTQEN